MKYRVYLIAAMFFLAGSGCPDRPPEQVDTHNPGTQKNFDAVAAWDEFEALLRLHYAYLERDDFDVDAQLARSARLAKAATSEARFRRILHRTAYTFTDPHFIVGPFENDDYNIVPTSSDLKVRWDDDKLVIVDVRQGTMAYDLMRPGWFVISINDEPARAAATLPFRKVRNKLTPRQWDYGANLAVNGKRVGVREIEVITHMGETKTITLPSPRDYAIDVSKMPPLDVFRLDVALKPASKTVSGETVVRVYGKPSSNTAIIRINNQLGNNDLITAFDKAIESVMDTDQLILDLRNTPSGGNTEVARSIIGHFITETKAYQVHEIPSLEREFSVPRRFVEQVKPRLPYYGKPVTVLGGHWTGSMGEGLVIGLHAAAGAHTKVSDMGDLLGGLRNYTLKNANVRIDFGNESLFHVNGTPRENFRGDVYLEASDMSERGGDPHIPGYVILRAKEIE